MFWLNKNSNKKKNTGKRRPKGDDVRGKSAKGQQPSSEDIREQALANARAARENIGDETLQRIAEAMSRKQNSATERAKADIVSADADRVAEEILYMLDKK